MLVSLYLWRDVVGNMRYNGRRYAYNGCTNGKIRWHTSICNRRWVVRLADSVEYRMEIIGCTHTSSACPIYIVSTGVTLLSLTREAQLHCSACLSTFGTRCATSTREASGLLPSVQ